MALVPVRPSDVRTPVNSPIRPAAPSVPKGVNVDSQMIFELTRLEIAARKEIRCEEIKARADVEFMVAVLCTDFRRRPRKPKFAPHAPGQLTVVKEPYLVPADQPVYVSPTRISVRAPEPRPLLLKMKALPAAIFQLQDDEAALRLYLEGIESKIFSLYWLECDGNRRMVQQLSTVEQDEIDHRATVEQDEQEALTKILSRTARSHGFISRSQKRLPPPPQTPMEALLAEEEAAYKQLLREETEGRKVCHDALILGYGVRIFSVNRVEVVERYDIEEEFDTSLQKVIAKFLFEEHRATPTLSLLAFHAAPNGSLLRQATFIGQLGWKSRQQ